MAEIVERKFSRDEQGNIYMATVEKYTPEQFATLVDIVQKRQHEGEKLMEDVQRFENGLKAIGYDGIKDFWDKYVKKRGESDGRKA